MDNLRLILLIIGIIFIAGLYLYGRIKSGEPLRVPRFGFPRLFSFRRHSRTDDLPVLEQEVAYDSDGPDQADIDALSRMSHGNKADDVDTSQIGPISALSEEDSYTGKPLVIVFSVMARGGHHFNGMDVLDVLLANGMEHGDMDIFHYHAKQVNSKHAVFSLANAVEPGTFDLKNIEALHTPGLSMFMQLPGPLEGREAFEVMLKTGRDIAEQLNGELCDDSRSVMTMQTIEHIKEQIEAFRFKQKMSALQKHRH